MGLSTQTSSAIRKNGKWESGKGRKGQTHPSSRSASNVQDAGSYVLGRYKTHELMGSSLPRAVFCSQLCAVHS